MNLTFEKKNLTNYQSKEFGDFENCNLYSINESQKFLGYFIISKKVGYISTDTSKLRIDITNHFFKPSRFDIFDLKTDLIIGKYSLPSWRIWKEIGTLTLNDTTYFCKKQRADIRYNLFKKSTWGRYQLKVFNKTTEIVYSIKVETKWFESVGNEFRNATGEIRTEITDKKLLLIGFFFIERLLNISDSDSA